MNGLLPTEFDDPRNQGLLGAALAMLAASGPSPQKRTFGQILGGAGIQGMQQYDQARLLRQRDEENRRRNQLTDMQIQKMRQQLAEEQQVADAARTSMLDRNQMALAAGGGPTNKAAEVQASLPQGATSFDQQAFTNKLFGINPLLALKMQQELRAQRKPIVAGNVVLDPDTYKPIYEPPTKSPDDKESEYERLIRRANDLNTPPEIAALLRKRAEYLVTRQEPNLIIRDIPGVGTVALNPKNATQVGQPLAPPELKDVPATVKTAVANNESLINSIDDAIKAVESNKQSFGLEYSLGDWFNQRYDPQGVGPRAKVANIGSKKLHDRSGAAVSAREFPRLAPFIPAVNDTPSAVVRKLEEMKRVVEEETGGLKFNYGTDSGYKPFGAQQRSATQPTNDGRMATEGRMPTPDEIDAELQRRMRR